MGWVDRIDSALRDMGGAAWAMPGLAVDLATAPWNNDKDYNGFLHTLSARGGTRFGSLLKPVSDIPGVSALAVPYRELVAEPLTTASLAEQSALYGGSSLLNSETWRNAYQQAQTTSLGQAGFLGAIRGGLAVGTGDRKLAGDVTGIGGDELSNFEQLRAAPGWLGNLATASSGATDFAASFGLDPLLAGGKAAKVARVAELVRPLEKVGGVAKYTDSSAYSRWRTWALDNNSGRQSVDFYNNAAIRRAPDPAGLSAVLSDASRMAKHDGGETFDLVNRVALGDKAAIEELGAKRVDLAARVLRAETQQNDLVATQLEIRQKLDALRDTPTRGRGIAGGGNIRARMAALQQADEQTNALIQAAEDELQAATRDSKWVERIYEQRHGMVGSTPGAIGQGRVTNLRTRFKTADIYAPSLGSRTLRIIRPFTDRTPEGWLDLHDPQGVEEIAAMLNKARGITREEKAEALDRYMRATNETARMGAAQHAEAVSLHAVARRHGYTRDEADAIVAEHSRRRSSIMSRLSSNRYSAATMTDESGGRKLVDVLDDDGTPTAVLESQLPNRLPLMDIAEYERTLSRHKSYFRAAREFGGEARDIITDGLDVLNGVWKFSVLTRLGFPVRNVVEGNLRMMAALDGHLLAETAGQALHNFFAKEARQAGADFRKAGDILARRADLTPEQLSKRVIHPDELRAMGVDEEVIQALGIVPPARIGEGGLDVAGVSLADIFDGSTGDVARDLASSNPLALQVARRHTQKVYDATAGTGKWSSINPVDHPQQHGPAWLNAVREQIGNSAPARMILKGKTPEEVARWLTVDPAGRKVRDRLGAIAADPRAYAERVAAHVEHYVPQGLEQSVLKGTITQKELEHAIRDAGERPVVHGELLGFDLGANAAAHAFNGLVDRTMKFLGQIPTEKLNQHPTAAIFYKQKARELVNAYRAEDVAITPEDLAHIEKQARQYAIREMRRLLYTGLNRSNAADMFRFVSPFFSAWQNALGTWGRIMLEDPSVAVQANKIWQAPSRAGIVVDRDGNPITKPQGITDNAYIQLQVPEYIRKQIPGMQAQGNKIRIAKTSLNIALQGDPWWLPGAGPVVQAPVNELVKDKPTVAESLKFILPFGPSQDVKDVILPTGIKRMQTDDEDRWYIQAKVWIMQSEAQKFKEGKRAKAPTWSEVEAKARSFKNLRTAVAFIAPFSVGFTSPYQFYIDKARQYQAADPQHGFERFMADYPDYADFATTISKNNAGIPASQNAFRATQRYKDLIADAPELGGLVVGPEGAGQFSSPVYLYQLATPVGPGSDVTFRSTQSPQEAVEANDARQGWVLYQKLMGQVETARIDRGLVSLRSKGAEDLRAIRDAAVAKLREKYPGWAKDFDTRDEGQMERRIAAMRKIVADPRLVNNPVRTDIKVLGVYLQARDLFVQELAARKAAGGSGTLSAGENADLAALWDAVTGRLVESDTKFTDLYNRWLTHDELAA